MAKSINLLPQEEFEASTLGRLLHWTTSSFRIIVIITEMVVMAAFLSRFWLDAQNSDLNDSIKVKAAQISTQKDFENQFRKIQTRLNVFKSISAETQPSVRIDLIASKIPNEVILSSVAVDSKSATIKGTSASEFGIAQFISNLKTEPTFKSVVLGDINSSQNNAAEIDFSIKISF